jgi:hypothetical protein
LSLSTHRQKHGKGHSTASLPPRCRLKGKPLARTVLATEDVCRWEIQPVVKN